MKQSINFSKTYQSQFKSEETIERVQICNKTSSRIFQTNRMVLNKKNNETIQQKKDNSDQVISKSDIKCKSISRLKQIFIMVTILQFFILFTLVLIQFITFHIKLALFIILQTSVIGIHFFLILASPNTQFFHPQQIHQQPICSIEQNKNTNFPKNNQKQLNKQHNKTTKMSPFKFSLEEYNIKQGKFSLGSQNKDRMNNTIKMIKNSMNASILAKILQTILSIALPTVFLSTFQQNIQGKIAIFILSLSSYALTLTSAIISIIFIRNIHAFLQNQVDSKTAQDSIHVQFDFNPSIFVDRMMKQQQGKIKSHHTIISIEKSLKSVKYVNIQNDMSHKECQDNRQKCQDSNKVGTKKSVLKSKKEQKCKQNKKIDIITAEKRRVQINEKTVQFFQYAQICPNDSTMQEKGKKINSCSEMVRDTRLVQIRKKWQGEAKVLETLRARKQRKVKSSTNLSVK